MGWFRKDRDAAVEHVAEAPAAAPPTPAAVPSAPATDGDAVYEQFELVQAIAGAILTNPELADPEWDALSLVAEVSDQRVAVAVYRYTDGGPPVPTRPPRDLDLFRQLRDHLRGTAGVAWEVVVVKIHRDTANVVTDFVYADGADRWRIRPENLDHLPELARPRPEDFAG